jgi:hypothetical protein
MPDRALDVEPDSPIEAPTGEPRGETVREGGLQQQQQKTEGHTAAAAACEASAREFASILKPLEEASGKRLGGPGLELCRAAFRENPHGFRLCAKHALRRATENALGLLVRMVDDGDHRGVPPPSAPASSAFESAERWLRRTGRLYEPSDFADELARLFSEVVHDELARQRLDRLYDALRAEGGE